MKEESRSTPHFVPFAWLGLPMTHLRARLGALLAAAGRTWSTTLARATPAPARRFPAWWRRLRVGLLVGLVGCEGGLLLISLVPSTIWERLGHPDGPLPHALFPPVAGLFYLLPTLIGVLCRRWPAALALATLPAWVDLGVFAVAAAPRLGPFYLAQDPHAVGAVGTIELFAALGLLGWVARRALLDLREHWKAAH